MSDVEYDSLYDGTNADRLMPLDEAVRHPLRFLAGFVETHSVVHRPDTEVERAQWALTEAERLVQVAQHTLGADHPLHYRLGRLAGLVKEAHSLVPDGAAWANKRSRHVSD